MSVFAPTLDMVAASLLFGPVCTVLGWYSARSARETIRLSRRRGEFEPVEAEILHSKLVEKESYRPAIRYRYTVDGEEYTSSSVYPGNITGSGVEEQHRKVVDAHPEGETARAWYDPRDPSTSFLVNRSMESDGSLALLVSMAFLLIGVGLLAYLAVLGICAL